MKIDKQIKSYLDKLSPRQKKAVLTVVKTLAEDQAIQEEISTGKSDTKPPP